MILINYKKQYPLNAASYVNADDPLKLANHFNITGFRRNTSDISSNGDDARLTLSRGVGAEQTILCDCSLED